MKGHKEKEVYKRENHAVPFGSLLHQHIMNIAKQIMEWTYQWGYKFGYSDGKEGRPEDETFSMSRDAESELEALIDQTFYKAELIEMVRERNDG